MSLTQRLNGAWQQGLRWADEHGAAEARDRLEQRLTPYVLKKVTTQVIAFVRRSGVKVVDLAPGRVVCRMPLKGNKNHLGTMYAGALFTLAEFPGGALFAATFDWRRYVPIVTDLNLQFVKPARTDVTVEFCLSAAEIERMNREVQEQGKSIFVLDGELKDANGEIVARSHGEYQLRPKRK